MTRLALPLALALVAGGCVGGSASAPTTGPAYSASSISAATPTSATSAAAPSSPVASYAPVAAAGRVLRDLGYGPDVEQRLDLYLPRGATRAPVVLFVHGGAWFLGDKTMLDGTGYLSQGPATRDLLLRKGFAIVSMNYRRSGSARFPAQLDDVRAALAFVRARPEVEGARVALFGESAGGHLAALAALEGAPVRAVVDYYGVSDLRSLATERAASGCAALPTRAEEMLLGVAPGGVPASRVGAEASPLTHVRPGAPPFFVVHGTQDCTVPIAQSQRLVEALRAVGTSVEYRTLDAGHAAPSFWTDPGVQQGLVTFLDTHLR